MEYKFEALQTIHKGETMKKKWQKNLEEVMLLLVAGKEKKAKLECGVLSELHMKTWKKKEEKKDMNEERKNIAKKRKMNSQLPDGNSCGSPTPNFTKISHKIWKSRIETNLRPSLPQSHQADIHDTRNFEHNSYAEFHGIRRSF